MSTPGAATPWRVLRPSVSEEEKVYTQDCLVKCVCEIKANTDMHKRSVRMRVHSRRPLTTVLSLTMVCGATFRMDSSPTVVTLNSNLDPNPCIPCMHGFHCSHFLKGSRVGAGAWEQTKSVRSMLDEMNCEMNCWLNQPWMLLCTVRMLLKCCNDHAHKNVIVDIATTKLFWYKEMKLTLSISLAAQEIIPSLKMPSFTQKEFHMDIN